MPTFIRDDVKIQYDVHGSGYPLTLFSPGGMNSIRENWRVLPTQPNRRLPWIDPRTALSDVFQVISMDQRNAGDSFASISASDGWANFTRDQMALLDHLGVSQSHLMGGCIGSSFCLAFIRAAPSRVTAAVLQNPIGLTPENTGHFLRMFDEWAVHLRSRRSDVDESALSGLRHNLFGGEFVFSVDRAFLRECPVPILILAGDDTFHPKAISEEIASLAPRAEIVFEWAGSERYAQTRDLVYRFLQAHTPKARSMSTTRIDRSSQF